jgi:hypothetical protein
MDEAVPITCTPRLGVCRRLKGGGGGIYIYNNHPGIRVDVTRTERSRSACPGVSHRSRTAPRLRMSGALSSENTASLFGTGESGMVLLEVDPEGLAIGAARFPRSKWTREVVGAWPLREPAPLAQSAGGSTALVLDPREIDGVPRHRASASCGKLQAHPGPRTTIRKMLGSLFSGIP